MLKKILPLFTEDEGFIAFPFLLPPPPPPHNFLLSFFQHGSVYLICLALSFPTNCHVAVAQFL